MSTFFLQATTTTTIFLLSLLLATPTISAGRFIVRDENDNPVVSETYYYAWAIVLGPNGGAISMFNNDTLSSTCPSFIVSQSNISFFDIGIPIKFTPQNQHNSVVTSENLNIAFKFLRPEPSCHRRYTTVWTVSGPENGNAVVLDGELRSDGSWFKLEETIPTLYTYSIWYGDKPVLYEQQANGQILLGLDKGHPLIVILTRESDIFPMSPSLFAQELLAKKYKMLQNLFIDKSHSI